MNVRYQDLTEEIPASQRPWLDRAATVEPDRLDPHALAWWRDGVVHLPNFIPDPLLDAYVRLRSGVPQPGGWRCPVPYLYYRELRDLTLYPPLMAVMRGLLGFEMGVHLNLTGWISTERALHCDDYLNPEFVRSHYCAAWIALDDIAPESGPFQYVAGSHRWPTIRRHKIFAQLTPEERARPSWPADTQGWVEAACLREVEARGAHIATYLPKRGDVLLWHGCLLHRGSMPAVPGTLRKALIAHYSSIRHRPDMPLRRRWNGQWLFVLEHPLDPGSPAPTIPFIDVAATRLLSVTQRIIGKVGR